MCEDGGACGEDESRAVCRRLEWHVIGERLRSGSELIGNSLGDTFQLIISWLFAATLRSF